MSTTPYTVIPSSQPSCELPIPQCPNSTTTTTNPGEPMGCFLQTNGLFCAPIATTRGFLLSLDAPLQQQQQQQQQQRGVLPFLVPWLSTANSNNNNATLVGVDGRLVNYQGPARLGETCYPIPLPPTTDPLFQKLVTVANHRLNETLSGGTEATPTLAPGGRDGYRSPGVGAGEQVFSFRGDCEQGSYCDLVPSTPAGAGGTVVVVTGTCKEVLPNFHYCTSYAQCSSLRCDHPWIDGGGGGSRNSTAGNTVCLPSKLDRGNINNGGNGGGGGPGGGSGGDKPSKFPGWIGGIIAIVVVFGAAIVFGLVRRRKKMATDKEKKTLKQRRRSARSQVAAAAAAVVASERERRKSMSLPLHSQQPEQENHHFGDFDDDKESDYVYQLHSAEPSLIINEKQELSVPERGSGGGGFGRWFRRSRTEDQMDRELRGERESVATGSSRSSIKNSLSLDQDARNNLQYYEGQQPGSLTTEGYGVPLSAYGTAAAAARETSAESIHSDSNTAVVLDSTTNPRSRLSIIRPRIVTTPSDSAAAAVPGAYGEGEERDVVSTGLSYHHHNNLNNQPSFSSATSSSLNGSGVSPSSPPSSDLSRRSSNHAFLAAASTPPPGSPASPISPISPRPPLSSGPSSRSSQRQSFQQQQQASPRRT